MSTTAMVGPTGVEARIATIIPKTAQAVDMHAESRTVPLKVLERRIAASAGKIISAEVRSEPTRFIASTMSTAVITARGRL